MGFLLHRLQVPSLQGQILVLPGTGIRIASLLCAGWASLLFPSVFSSDAMQWVPHLSFLALPVTAIVGARLLRRFEARHPEEAERSRRTEEEQFR